MTLAKVFAHVAKNAVTPSCLSKKRLESTMEIFLDMNVILMSLASIFV